MTKIRLTKEFNFEMAHVLEGYDGPCRNVHGHSYRLGITVIGIPIDDMNSPKYVMVMDFGELKAIVKNKVIDRFDHVLLVRTDSQLAEESSRLCLGKIELVDYQPTCENILNHIVHIISKELPPNVKLMSVRLHETASSYAEWHSEDN